jgi:SPP1 gp7 family putative phage head morphogenesis protein
MTLPPDFILPSPDNLPQPSLKGGSMVRAMAEFNQRLAEQDAEQTLLMAKRWKMIEDRLWVYFDALLDEIAAKGLRTSDQIYRLYRYEQLIRTTQDEINQFEAWSGQQIMAGQQRAMDLGFEAAVYDIYKGQYFTPMVNKQALANMVGVCADGAPLFSLLKERALTPEAVGGLTEALTEGVALGWNPRKTARVMADGLAQGFNKAQVIARTEQIRVYREATRAEYAARGVEQYQRHCSKSDRTCPVCLALDGEVYPVKQIMPSHPGCRCFMTRYTGEKSDYKSAQDWFAGLKEERQREILGRGHFELYQKGVPLREFVKVTDDPVWGPTLGLKPLKEIDPAWAKNYKTQLGKEAYARLSENAHNNVELQNLRIAEIESMGNDGVNVVLDNFAKATELPKPVYHFNKHSARMEINSQEEYLKSYQQFVQRNDLRLFTFIDKTGDRMWYKADLESGFVAQYNETKGKAWSYYKQDNIFKALASRKNWLIEVISNGNDWEIQKWNNK